MPKIILNLRENILKESKRILKTESYDKLTVRRVAKACGVAVGTVYNYFPSKEMLTAGVMLDDWQRSLEQMRQVSAEASSSMEGLERIYAVLLEYIGEYTETWDQYRARGGRADSPYRHHILVEQIADVIRTLLDRFGNMLSGRLPAFLAENLLILAAENERDLSSVEPIFGRLLN